MARDAEWLHSLPKGPGNAARVGDVDWSRVTAGRALVRVDVDLDDDRRRLPAVATGWTREHVRVEVNVPFRGVMLLWLAAADVTRRGDDA